jgi:hypothetical protein
MLTRDMYCNECGVEVLSMNREEFFTHMVNSHGYRRIGENVFKHRVCRMCSKTALYKVGCDGYCKDHYQNAVDRRLSLDKKVFAPRHAVMNKAKIERDRIDISKRRLHETKERYG